MKIKGSKEIEGLIALKKDEISQTTFIEWMVAAPHNNKEKSLTGDKKYNGVGGHLLAIAADKSKEFGYNGCISAYAASDEVLQYYLDKTGALSFGHDRRVFWLDDAAENIIRRYNYEYE